VLIIFLPAAGSHPSDVQTHYVRGAEKIIIEYSSQIGLYKLVLYTVNIKFEKKLQ
jgi:hypothetical protein